MGLKSWLVNKVAYTILAFAIVYLTGSALDLVPQSMKDTVSWFGDNFQGIVLAGCFALGCYTVLKFLDHKKQNRE